MVDLLAPLIPNECQVLIHCVDTLQIFPSKSLHLATRCTGLGDVTSPAVAVRIRRGVILGGRA